MDKSTRYKRPPLGLARANLLDANSRPKFVGFACGESFFLSVLSVLWEALRPNYKTLSRESQVGRSMSMSTKAHEDGWEGEG